MDLSSVTELTPLAEVIRDVLRVAKGAGAEIFVAGAVARDLWLWHVHRIRTGRATADLDFAVQCENWHQFELISKTLVVETEFEGDPKKRHRFLHRNGMPVDLVPFGGIEKPDRTIAWPPDESHVMSLLGFREVLGMTVVFHLPGGVSVPVVSLPSLVALKLIAWQDRRLREPGKDAADLDVIFRSYSDAGNTERMFNEIPGLDERTDFDFELAGAELLGRDLGKTTGAELIEAIRELLEVESNAEGELRLAREMRRGDEESARRRLSSVLRGLTAGGAGK
jgi:predicted nucleotidyltransferase